MNKHPGRHRPKRVGIFASVLSVPFISLLVLRSVVAFTFFNGVNETFTDKKWEPASEDSIMQPGEVVVFEASYLIFKLGTVRFELLGKQECRGKPAYRILALIDSYSGIPFVNLHAVYQTCADARTLICLSTSNDQQQGDDWVHTNYVFNYSKKKLEWDQSVKGVIKKEVDLPLDTTYTDGLSFFYFVRNACREADGHKMELEIPIVSDTIRSSVSLTINERREPCDVATFDFPVEAERLSGHINFEGTFGVTGDFVGWISTDSAEVPLRADLKVLLGSIVVKLKHIDRAGWVPPKAD